MTRHSHLFDRDRRKCHGQQVRGDAGIIGHAHDNFKILCVGVGITRVLEVLDILEAWLFTPYDGGGEDISLALTVEAEKPLSQAGEWAATGPMR